MKQISIFHITQRTIHKKFQYAEIKKEGENSLNPELQAKTIIDNMINNMKMGYCTPACGYWLQNSTLPSVKYLDEKPEHSLIDDKFLLFILHDTTMKSGSMFPLQTFKIYSNSESLLQDKYLWNTNTVICTSI